MATGMEDLKVLQAAENTADKIWQDVSLWNLFARDTVGKQLARAADSIGANVAESFGRFHFGDKLNFLYSARGSVFATKYWLNRGLARELLSRAQVEGYAAQLTAIARQLNAFASSLKSQKYDRLVLREPEAAYEAADEPLFSQFDLDWLLTVENPAPAESPISSLQSPEGHLHD
ncbi:MAG TPA: four helix bundle protein [Anaerolineae bacterium]